RLGSPLVLGIADGEAFLASDPAALAGRARQVAYLADRQVCVLTAESWQLLDDQQAAVSPTLHDLADSVDEHDAGAYGHFMLKEIYEQPEALENALRGRLDEADATAKFGGLNLSSRQLRDAERIILTGCGTSYHAALVGEYLIEEFARVPVEVEYASECRHRNPPIERGTIVVAVTQSGEAADALAALLESEREGDA